VNGEVETLRADGTVIHHFGETVGDPAWSVDRSRIAWLTAAGVFVADSDGGHRRWVPWEFECTPRILNTFGCSSATTFALSPGGKTVLMGNAGRAGNRLSATDVDTGRAVDVAPAIRPIMGAGPWGYDALPYSPDGRWMLYLRQDESCLGGVVILARANGKHPRRILCIRDSSDFPSIAWAPNSRLFAFLTEGRGDPGAAVYDLGRHRVFPIHHVFPWVRQVASWSPDSRSVAIAPSDGPIVIVSTPWKVIRRTGLRGLSTAWRGSDLIILNRSRVVRVYNTKSRRTRVLFRAPRGRAFGSLMPR
jgi:hypothetical protein